jgi:hypothetical protein
VLPHDYNEEQEPVTYTNLGNVESTHDTVEDHQLTNSLGSKALEETKKAFHVLSESL